MMAKICVNGANTCEAYQMLKGVTTQDSIRWNFHTKFLVSKGAVEISRHNGVDPDALEPQIMNLLGLSPKEEE